MKIQPQRVVTPGQQQQQQQHNLLTVINTFYVAVYLT
jgi:hypothetical protein